jgi:hypothetical protein
MERLAPFVIEASAAAWSGMWSGAGGADPALGDGAAARSDASLQQLFVDARGHVGTTLLGAMVGRQEFADGPRQPVSLSDGPNVHRTWNSVRLYAHGRTRRFGAFGLRGTRHARGAFDEAVDRGERLRG